ncbi:MAG: T9SS type A sorting domain-containing protein [Bacteroidia bacterium]
MKIFTLLIVFFLSSVFCEAQDPVSGRSMLFSTDVIVHTKASENQRHPKIASAFNGWLYAANTINDTSSKKGGIYLSISKDNGATWNKLATYQFSNSFYQFTDVAVAGPDTAHLGVFLAGTLHNTLNGTNSLYIDKFDGRNGNLLNGQVFARNLGTLSVTDMAVSTDNQFPSSYSAPYGISIVYGLHGGTEDSLLYASSTDGGLTFEVQNTIAHSTHAFRKVALAYGKSPAIPGGAYFVSWEVLQNTASTLGHIYLAHTHTDITAGWGNPVCLDSLSSALNNLCRYPSLSCQQSTTNNDAGDISVIVSFEKASGGNMNNMDIAGCATKRGVSANLWVPFIEAGSPENDLEPSLAYNTGTNHFLITYFDSTNGRIGMAAQDMNLSSLSSWNYLTTQLNDQRSNLKAPWPVVGINLQLQQPCCLWVSENPGNQNGIVLFDAEYAGVATAVVNVAPSENRIGNLYPNPASGRITLPLTLQESQKLYMVIYDMLGNIVREQEIPMMAAGNQTATMDISELENGIYFCHAETEGMKRIIRFAVQH